MDPGPDGPTTFDRAKRLYVIRMVIIVLSLCLQVAGFVSPGWYVFKYAESDLHMGLWYARICPAGRCRTIAFDVDAPENDINEYRVEASLALGFIIIAVILETRLHHKHFWYACTGVILLTLISGILALVASGKSADITRKNYSLWKRYVKSEDNPIRFPYSAFLTCLGGIFACVGMIVGVCSLKPCTISESVPSPPAYQMTSEPPPYSTLFTAQENVSYPHQGHSHLAQQNAVQHAYTAYPEKGDLLELNVQSTAQDTRC